MTSVLMNTIVFEDCRNQWSVSRPLLGLILLDEKVGVMAARPQGATTGKRQQPCAQPRCDSDRQGSQLSLSCDLEHPGTRSHSPGGSLPSYAEASGLAFLEPRARAVFQAHPPSFPCSRRFWATTPFAPSLAPFCIWAPLDPPW